MGVYPQSIPSFGVHTLHGRRMKLFPTFKKFHTHKTFIPTNSGPLGESIPKRPRFRLCEVYPRLLRGETHDSGTVRRVTKLAWKTNSNFSKFVFCFFNSQKPYPKNIPSHGRRMEERCIPREKGAYPAWSAEKGGSLRSGSQ